MKKFKLLSLALAFCMIASIIPAPVASAADVAYPKVIDLKYDGTDYKGNDGVWSILTVTYNPRVEHFSDIGDNKPTLSENEYEFDFENSSSACTINAETTHVYFRLMPNTQMILNVKTPKNAGKYNVYIEGKADGTALTSEDIETTVGESESTLVAAGTTAFTKIADSYVLTGTEESVAVKFKGLSTSSNVNISKIVFIPADAITLNFANNSVTTAGRTNVANTINYEDHGCKLIKDKTVVWNDSNFKLEAARLYFRGTDSSTTTPTLTFEILIPDDGTYSVSAYSQQLSGSKWDVTIGGNDAGVLDLSTSENDKVHPLNNVTLEAGVNELVITHSEYSGGWGTEGSKNNNNGLYSITLTPVEEEEPEKAVIPASDIFGDVYAYVEDDTLYFIGGIEEDAIDGYAEVGFEVKVDGEEAGDINTTQVYTSFTIGSDTYKATEKFGSEYVFITKLENVGDASSVTVSPYVKDADGVKTFHVDDANNDLALTLNLK